MQKENHVFYFNTDDHHSSIEFGKCLFELLDNENPNRPLVFLCIGSDRATGDCLGPLIGHRLCRFPSRACYTVYGNLSSPVHAKNLSQTIQAIYKNHLNPIIVAIDASLGKSSHIGYYTLSRGALKPGAGTGKDLPSIGDYCITGIVNNSGFLEQTLLQTTPLSRVMTLTDHICEGICYFNYRRQLPDLLYNNQSRHDAARSAVPS